MLRKCTMCLVICFSLLYVSSVVFGEPVQYERLCANPDCSEPISVAKAQIQYSKHLIGGVSFEKGNHLTVFSKAVPEDVKWGYWEAQVVGKEGKIGLVPPSLIREDKVFKKTELLQRVLTEAGLKRKNAENISKEVTNPILVTPTQNYVAGGVAAEVGDGGPPSTHFEVFDGTTIYTGTDGEATILATSTQQASLKTEAPVNPSLQPAPVTEEKKTEAQPLAEESANDVDDEHEDEEDDDEEGEGEDDEEEDEEESVEESVETTATPHTDSPASDLVVSGSPPQTKVDPGTDQEQPSATSANGEVETISSTEAPSPQPSEADPGPSFLKNLPDPVSPLSLLKIVDDSSSSELGGLTDDGVVPKPIAVSQPPTAPPSPTSSLNLNVERVQLEPPKPEQEQQKSSEATQHDTSGETEHPSTHFENVGQAPPIALDQEGSPESLRPTPPPDVLPFHPTKTLPPQDKSKPSALLSSSTDPSRVPPSSGDSESVETSSSISSGDAESTQAPPYTESYQPPPSSTPSGDSESAQTSSSVPSGDAESTQAPPYTESYQSPPSSTPSGESESAQVSHSNVLSGDTETVIPLAEKQEKLPAGSSSAETVSPPEEVQPVLNNEDASGDLSSKDELSLPHSHVLTESSDIKDFGSTPSSSPEDINPYGGSAISQESPFVPEISSSPSLPPAASERIVSHVPPVYDLPPTTPSDPKEFPFPPPTRAPMYPGLFPKREPIRPSDATPSEEDTKPSVGVGSVEMLTPQVPEVVPESVEEDVSSEDPESPGMFSGITGFFSGLFGSGEKAEQEDSTEPQEDSTEPQEDSTEPQEESTEPFVPPVPDPAPFPDPISAVPPLANDAVPEGECKTVGGLESGCADAPSPPHLLEFFEKTVPETSYTFLYLVVTSVTVLIFTLGYYFIERTRQDGPLIAKVNKLTHELQVATSQLEAKNKSAQDSVKKTNNEQLASVQIEVNDLKQAKAELESQLESQQQELDAATEAGLELNRMLTDLLTQRQGSDALLKSVEELQGQLNEQQRVIDEMSRSLQEKSQENETLQSELTGAQEKIENLEEELNDMRQNLNMHLKEKETMLWELESRNAKLEADLAALEESKTAEMAALTETVAELKERAAVRDSEFKALSETIEELKSRGDVDPTVLYNVGRTKAELARALSDKEALQERLSEEEGARKLLEDHVKSVDEEVSSLRSSFESAEKEKLEAETRLTVLSNYFKEKETQLQKELGLQEAMWIQKQGDDTTVYERIKSLQEEVESYNFDSFQNSNEGISVTNSLSSMCTDPPSSLTNLPTASISPKLTESLWSLPAVCKPSPSLSLRSLPITPSAKPRVLTRRKSSVDFEARLERVQIMMAPEPTPTVRALPDDLLKLQELKTVRASPFRESNASPEPKTETLVVGVPDLAEPFVKCSELVDKFEKIRKPDRILSVSSDFNKIEESEIKEAAKFSAIGEKLRMFDPFVSKEFPKSAVPFDCLNTSEQGVPYTVGDVLEIGSEPPSSALLPLSPGLSLPLIPVPTPLPAPRTSRSSPHSDKSESEDSQSMSKDCELGSSATLELDIKVVANTTAGVKKFKKKSTRQKNGAQSEILKKEILDQERGLKGQIATLEKKAHENWVAARQAERRLEESKQEAGQLRNMLTLMEKTTGPEGEAKPAPRHPGELNGEDSLPPLLPDGTSPLPLPPLPLDPMGPPPMLPPGFMPPFMPPPPGGFIPPPPFHPGDRRPPPLGRMSSPPLNRFSPQPGDFGYDRMSPPPLSPPVRSYRSPPAPRSPPSPWDEPPPPRGGFRPVASQRDHRRDYPGGSNSGHSSSESIDKPTRRGKNV